MRYDGEGKNYVEKMKYALLSKKEKARFPEDEEFLDCFEKKQMYFMNSKKIYQNLKFTLAINFRFTY